MRETLIVSNRGQITLPAGMLEVERYSDQQIAEWDREDSLSPSERNRILARLEAMEGLEGLCIRETQERKLPCRVVK